MTYPSSLLVPVDDLLRWESLSRLARTPVSQTPLGRGLIQQRAQCSLVDRQTDATAWQALKQEKTASIKYHYAFVNVASECLAHQQTIVSHPCMLATNKAATPYPAPKSIMHRTPLESVPCKSRDFPPIRLKRQAVEGCCKQKKLVFVVQSSSRQDIALSKPFVVSK